MTDEYRVLIGNTYGDLISEIEPAEIDVVQWRLNNVASFKLKMARNDPKLTEDNFRPGNRLLLEFTNGLPLWGGIIDPPRQWTADYFETQVYSAEYLLTFRHTDRGRYFSKASPGHIFRSVLTEAFDLFPLRMNLGDVYEGRPLHSPEYHFKKLEEILSKSLPQIADTDYWVEPRLEDNRIVFYAHHFLRRGAVKENVMLYDGQNIADLELVEQGPIVNWWDLAGQGTGWGNDRVYSHSRDVESMAKYGLRQDSAIFSDISEQATLDDMAEFLLKQTKDPLRRWSLTALNVKPALFSSYDIGDTVGLYAPDAGFDGYNGGVRLLARNYDDGKCVLVVEEDAEVDITLLA